MARPGRRRALGRVFFPFSVGALFLLAPGVSQAKVGDEIDLSSYEISYSEEFDTLSVSPWGPVDAAGRAGTSRWIAHTPWNGDFGEARFADPLPGFPFAVKDGTLQIIAIRDGNGAWRSGMLAESDKEGRGFRQSFGYFEIRTKLPRGPGTWPAFWLAGNAGGGNGVEIDVFEHLGQFPADFHSTIHIWDKDGKDAHTQNSTIPVPIGSLYDRFNTFGVDVRPGVLVFYFNRKEVWRVAVGQEFSAPLYPLVSFALGGGFPIDKTPNPSFMYVDYIRVYKQNDAKVQ